MTCLLGVAREEAGRKPALSELNPSSFFLPCAYLSGARVMSLPTVFEA